MDEASGNMTQRSSLIGSLRAFQIQNHICICLYQILLFCTGIKHLIRSLNSENRSLNILSNNGDPPLPTGIVLCSYVFRPNIYQSQADNLFVAGPLKRRNLINYAQKIIPHDTLSCHLFKNLQTPLRPCTFIYNILILTYIVLIPLCILKFIMHLWEDPIQHL